MQGAENAFETLTVASSILSRSAAGAGEVRPGVIGGIGIEPTFQGARRQVSGCCRAGVSSASESNPCTAVGLRASQSRPGSPLEAPLSGRRFRGHRGVLQLAVGPLLAGLPVVLDLAAKLTAGFDLFLGYLRLPRAEKAGISLTRNGSGQAVAKD